jgi:hypothetical protein
VWLQMVAPFEAAADALKAFQTGLQDFIGNLKSSDLSPLSAQAQLDAARAQYETTLAKAKAGDETARGNLTGVAQAYLSEAQGAYASSPAYAAIFADIVSTLEALALNGTTSTTAAALAQQQADTPTFVAGPEGSSGGLSGAPELEPYDLTPLIAPVVDSSREQVAAVNALTEKLDLVLDVLGGIAGIEQLGHARGNELLEAITTAIGYGAQQERLTARETARA